MRARVSTRSTDEVDVYDGPFDDEEEDEVIAVIDESESEAAPRAID